MIIIRDVPIIEVQKALFSLLKTKQDTAIYGGDVPAGATLPYITFGASTAKPLLVKNTEMWELTTSLELWGNSKQQAKINSVLADITTLVSYYGEQLQLSNFSVLETDIGLVETFPETSTGYHGTVTLKLTLQRK